MSATPANEHPLNRREFLGASAKNAAGVAAGVAGFVGMSRASASPGEQVQVGVIGVRNQGKLLAQTLAGFADVAVTTVCDVDEGVFSAACQGVEAAQGRAPRCERDFRRLLDDRSLDAVVVATPDHWHAPITVLACQAGKDVYLESPVSHSFGEGPLMLATAQQSQRIVQAGLQQRSGAHFQSAVEYLHSGRLGTVLMAKAWTVHQRKSIGKRADCPPPPGVDYNLWLGPAAARPFNPNRFHHNWHWFWDYGAGELGNWGVHLLDVARWGLGVELPETISATGGCHFFHDDQQTPDTLQVNYGYPGKTITWEHRLWSPHGQEGRSAAVAFYGDRGTLIVDRGGWKVYGQKESATAGSSELLPPHLRNFIQSLKTREAPVADLESAHLSSGLCHLGNIAYRVGRTLSFDRSQGTIADDAEADALLRTTYRPLVAVR